MPIYLRLEGQIEKEKQWETGGIVNNLELKGQTDKYIPLGDTRYVFRISKFVLLTLFLYFFSASC